MAGMFGVGPSQDIMSQMGDIRRKMGGNTGIAGGMGRPRPQMGQPSFAGDTRAMPMPVSGTMPVGRPQPMLSQPMGMEAQPQANMPPISPSGSVINRFIPPQPGQSDFPVLGIGGRDRWRMY